MASAAAVPSSSSEAPRGRQPGQVGDHGLEVEQRLQAALGDLRLVRRVGGVPGRVLQDVAQDHRRGEGAVVAEADHRGRAPGCGRRARAARRAPRPRCGAGQVQRLGALDHVRHRGGGQLVEGAVADLGEHLRLRPRRRGRCGAARTGCRCSSWASGVRRGRSWGGLLVCTTCGGTTARVPERPPPLSSRPESFTGSPWGVPAFTVGEGGSRRGTCRRSRPAFQSDLVRAVRVPERFRGGVAPSAPPNLLRRTLPHRVSSRASLPAGPRAGRLEWPTSRMWPFVVRVEQPRPPDAVATSWRDRADRHRSAQPDRPQGVRPQRCQDRHGGRGLSRRRHRRAGVGGRTHRPLQPGRLRPAGAQRAGRRTRCASPSSGP